MTANIYYIIISIIVLWATWPSLAKISGLPGAFITLFMGIIGTIISLCYITVTKQDFSLLSKNPKGVGILLLVGVMNAFGSLLYNTLIKTLSVKDFQTMMMLVMIMIPIVAFTTSYSLFLRNESLPTNKVIGLAFGCIAIYFLNK